MVGCLEFQLWFLYSLSSLKNVMSVRSFASIFEAQCVRSLPSSYLASIPPAFEIPFISQPSAWSSTISSNHLFDHSVSILPNFRCFSLPSLLLFCVYVDDIQQKNEKCEHGSQDKMIKHQHKRHEIKY